MRIWREGGCWRAKAHNSTFWTPNGRDAFAWLCRSLYPRKPSRARP